MSDRKATPMTRGDIQSALQIHVADATSYLEAELSPARAKATGYYQGRKFSDIEGPKTSGAEQVGRSQFVLTILRDTINGMMNGIMRMFFGSERAVEYMPHGEEDVPAAEQATDYVNVVVLQQDNNGFTEFYAWFKDALIRSLGTMKYWWEDRSTFRAYTAERLDVNQYEALVADPDVQPTSVEEVTEGGITYRTVKYKHWRYEGVARIACVPPEEVLISRDARSREDATFIAHQTEKTRGELIAMGVDPKIIDEFGGPSTELRDSQEEIARRGGLVADTRATDETSVRHLWIESYPYLDVDGDGEAELVRCRSIGPGCHLVEDPEPIDERPLAFLTPDPEPHVVIGQSIADRTMDLQKIGSQIMRAINDSAAQAIFPDTAFQSGMVSRKDLASTAMGRQIECEGPPGVVLAEMTHEFVGAQLLPLLQYIVEKVKQDRVGPFPATLDPKALQSSTAEGVGATVQASSEQLELIARIFAETGVKQLFKGLLKLLVEHQPRARMVRLRNQYVSVDPRAWDADMDVSVNVALGARKEQQLAVLAATAEDQKQIIMTLGPSNPLCGLGQYRHTRAKMLELSGVKDVSNFYNDLPANWQPPPVPPQPDPNMVLAQAELLKAQGQLAKDKADFLVEQAKSQQSMAELRAQLVSKEADIAAKREEFHLVDDRERDKTEADVALRAAELNAKYGSENVKLDTTTALEREKMASQERIAAQKQLGNGNGKPRKKRMTMKRSDGRSMDVTVEEDE